MDKYEEIFNKVLDETEGDAITKFKLAGNAMKIAILKEIPVWMKFNMISWMIPNTDDKNINWAKVNELLKPNNEYDFNAFEYIDSKQKFYNAAVDSKIATVKEFNQPFVKRKCIKCGKEYTLTAGEVMFYCKKEWPLPNRCKICLAIKNGKKVDDIDKNNNHNMNTVLHKEEEPDSLNSISSALSKAGITFTDENK